VLLEIVLDEELMDSLLGVELLKPRLLGDDGLLDDVGLLLLNRLKLLLTEILVLLVETLLLLTETLVLLDPLLSDSFVLLDLELLLELTLAKVLEVLVEMLLREEVEEEDLDLLEDDSKTAVLEDPEVRLTVLLEELRLLLRLDEEVLGISVTTTLSTVAPPRVVVIKMRSGPLASGESVTGKRPVAVPKL